jgi:hypothetical protein
MAFFEEEFVKLMAQFRGDVLTSEEMQIFDVIRFDVLKGRNLIEQRKLKEELAEAERDLARRRDEDEEGVRTAVSHVRDLRAAMTALGSEYGRLQESHRDLLRALKSTREQRIKEINSGKDTVLGLIRQMQSEEFRELEGRELALARLAADREMARLSQDHLYEDGQMDRPVLTAEKE